MSVELKPREWLLALWANGTFTVEAEDSPCWQAIAPPAMIRAVAALPMEATINDLRASLAAAEAKLADEERHADELKEGLAACVGERATFYAGQSQTVTWAVAIEHAEHLLAAHAARRAGKAAVEREERAK